MPRSHYPSKSEVLARADRQTFRPGVLRFVRQWKREHRGSRRTPDAVRALLTGLAAVYEKPVEVVFEPDPIFAFMAGGYSRTTATIHLSTLRLSVLTALHEFAHHLYGPSERVATGWSVALFRRTFPRTFARGHFVGDTHMFVVPRVTETEGGEPEAEPTRPLCELPGEAEPTCIVCRALARARRDEPRRVHDAAEADGNVT